MTNNELTHYGVKGMKWGVRKKISNYVSDSRKRSKASTYFSTAQNYGDVVNYYSHRINRTKKKIDKNKKSGKTKSVEKLSKKQKELEAKKRDFEKKKKQYEKEAIKLIKSTSTFKTSDLSSDKIKQGNDWTVEEQNRLFMEQSIRNMESFTFNSLQSSGAFGF